MTAFDANAFASGSFDPLAFSIDNLSAQATVESRIGITAVAAPLSGSFDSNAFSTDAFSYDAFYFADGAENTARVSVSLKWREQSNARARVTATTTVASRLGATATGRNRIIGQVIASVQMTTAAIGRVRNRVAATIIQAVGTIGTAFPRVTGAANSLVNLNTQAAGTPRLIGQGLATLRMLTVSSARSRLRALVTVPLRLAAAARSSTIARRIRIRNTSEPSTRVRDDSAGWP